MANISPTIKINISTNPEVVEEIMHDPHTFSEGDMVLVYEKPNDKLGKGKFDSMWYEPYVIHHFLGKGAYTLIDSNGKLLENPHNGLYLKIFYT